MIRLFVALSFPEEIRQSLAALCAGVPGARWVNPDQFHLTLRFIGEVDGIHAELILQRDVCSLVQQQLDGQNMASARCHHDWRCFIGRFGIDVRRLFQ